MRFRVAIATLGCKVNQVESASLGEAFERKGHKLVSFKEKADIYIVNTCAVTARAAYESRQLIRRALKKKPLLVVACGCYAQVAGKELKDLVKEPVLILGQQEKAKLLEIIESLSLPLEKTIISVSDTRDLRVCEPYPLSRFLGHRRAFLRVQDGCSVFCSYCIVPYARGPSRSLPLEEIRSQVRRYLASGYKEIVVTGVHLGLYGRDLSPSRSLLDIVLLLEELKVPRFRLSSLEPLEISDELLDLLARAKGFCPHFHISLQSGSDEVLKKMGRRYQAADFKTLVEKIKKIFPEAAIGADVIAGFPGEREEDFAKTFALLESLPISYLHVFPYSPRPGTKAASWPQVPPDKIAARAKKLQELSKAKRKAFLREQLGSEREVLVLRYVKEQGLYEGLTRNYVSVFFEADSSLLGEIARVKIERAVDSFLYGEIVRN